jgi:hypothetical protein
MGSGGGPRVAGGAEHAIDWPSRDRDEEVLEIHSKDGAPTGMGAGMREADDLAARSRIAFLVSLESYRDAVS